MQTLPVEKDLVMADAVPEEARLELAQLQERSPELFDAALAAFRAKRWTYRQLGEAVGLSHEAVRRMAARAPKVLPDLGFDVPERPRPLNVIPAAVLNEAIAADLKARLLAAISEETEERTPAGLKPAVADFFAGLQAAREAGWDNYSIGPAIGLHPRAVSRFAARRPEIGRETPAYPAAPPEDAEVLARAKRPTVKPVKVPARDSAAMRTDDEDGARLGRWYLLGASREELSAAAGQDWETVRKRLVRRGYMAGGR